MGGHSSLVTDRAMEGFDQVFLSNLEWERTTTSGLGSVHDCQDSSLMRHVITESTLSWSMGVVLRDTMKGSKQSGRPWVRAMMRSISMTLKSAALSQYALCRTKAI